MSIVEQHRRKKLQLRKPTFGRGGALRRIMPPGNALRALAPGLVCQFWAHCKPKITVSQKSLCPTQCQYPRITALQAFGQTGQKQFTAGERCVGKNFVSPRSIGSGKAAVRSRSMHFPRQILGHGKRPHESSLRPAAPKLIRQIT